MLFKDDKVRKVTRQFDELLKNTQENIESLRSSSSLTRFENQLFLLIFQQGNILAKELLKLPIQYFKEIVSLIDLQDILAIDSAYTLLCTQQLHVFQAVKKNKVGIANLMDVSDEQLVRDFSSCLSEDEALHSHIQKLLTKFSSLVDKEGAGDLRDLWFNNAITFGEILSRGSVNFKQHHDMKSSLIISELVQDFQIHLADFESYFKTVAGK